MRRWPLLLGLVAPLTGCMCGEALLEVPGAARGRICDADTGRGIGQVTVRVDVEPALAAPTSDDGAWGMGRLPAGPATFSATIDGALRTFDAVIESGATTIVVDPACRELPGLPGTGRIEGRVCNRHVGEVLIDAEVTVVVSDEETLTTHTDAEGRFSFEAVPAGPRVVVVMAPGFQMSRPVEVVEGETAILEAEGCAIDDPEVSDPPSDDPPSDDPPSNDPPSNDPPSDDPPNQDPPDHEWPDPCAPVEVDIFLLGDCLSVACPAATPVPVGCNVVFSPGDDRGCVAHTVGESDVYFQAGDQCNVGIVGGTLLCQAAGCGAGVPVALDSGNCPINKPVDIYAVDPDGCPDVH